MSIDWVKELPLIEQKAAELRVDPMFIAAIRETEQGGPGIEFGVEPPGQYDYNGQLELTCITVAHRLNSYPGNPLDRDPHGRVIYSFRWVAYFASIWAPVGASNDPNGLNQNWFNNCSKAYAAFLNQPPA